MDLKLASLLVLPISYIVWSLFSLASNYATAQKVGVQLIVLPISPLNPIWMLVDKFFIPILKLLPFGSGNFTRYQRLGWEFEDRSKTHEELGDAYMAVTPGKNWLYICDHEAISDLLLRRNEFKRPLEILGWSFTPIALPIAWVLLLLTEPQISSMYLVQMYLLYGLQWFIHSSFFG